MVHPKRSPIALSVVLVFAILLAACGGGASSSAPGSTPGSNLTGKTWQWQKTEFNGGKDIPVPNPANYTLLFSPTDNTVAIKADCNSGSGTYTITNGSELTIKVGAMTLAACAPDSLSNEFITELGQVISYKIENNGQLVLALNTGAGMRYSP